MPRAFWFIALILALLGLIGVGLFFQGNDEAPITGADGNVAAPPSPRPHRTGSPEASPPPPNAPKEATFSILDASSLEPLEGAEVWIAAPPTSPPQFFRSTASGHVPRPSSFPALVVVRALGHRFFAAELDQESLHRGVVLRKSFDLEVRLRSPLGKPIPQAEVVFIPPAPPIDTSLASRSPLEVDAARLAQLLVGQRQPDETLVNDLNDLERRARDIEDLVGRLDASKDCAEILNGIRTLVRSAPPAVPLTGDADVLEGKTVVFPRAKTSDAHGRIHFSGLLPFGRRPPAHIGLKRHHVLKARDAKGDLPVERKLMRQGPAVELVQLSHPPDQETLRVDIEMTPTAVIRGLCGFEGHGGRGVVELRRISEGKTAHQQSHRREVTVQFHAPSRLEAFRFENVLPGSYVVEAWWESGPHEISIVRREATVTGDEVVDLGRLLPEYDSTWTLAFRVRNERGDDLTLTPTPDDVALWLMTDFDTRRPQQPGFTMRLPVPLGTVKILGLPPQSHALKATLQRDLPDELAVVRSCVESSFAYDPNRTIDIVFQVAPPTRVRLRVRLPRPMEDPATCCWLVDPSSDLTRSITLVPQSKEDPSLLGGETECPMWGEAGFFARFRDGDTGSFLAVTRDLRSLPDPVTLEAQAGVALRGRLLDTEGDPYRDVLLHFELEWNHRPIPHGSLFTEVDHEGRFYIPGLPPGASVRFGNRDPVIIRAPKTGTRTADVVWRDKDFPLVPNPRASSTR